VKKKKPVQPIHVALRASSKDAVHQFHTAALKAGAKDNGPPGFRRQELQLALPTQELEPTLPTQPSRRHNPIAFIIGEFRV
jgi:hypothetical protein